MIDTSKYNALNASMRDLVMADQNESRRANKVNFY